MKLSTYHKTGHNCIIYIIHALNELVDLAAAIKNTIWLKRSLEAVINFYCIAPCQSRPPPDGTMPCLPGFERLAIA